MITLQKIAREVIRLESGGDQSNDSQLNEAYIVLLARQAANKLLSTKIYERLNEDDRTIPEAAWATYEISVLGDAPNKYIDLPEIPINTPMDAGLRIAPIEDPTNHFIPRHQPGVSRNLPCADLDPGQVSFWRKGKRVYFDGDEMELGKIMADIAVIAPDNVTPTDPLPMYPEQQFDLILMVRQMLQGQPIQDKILDNNKDVGVRMK